MPRHVQDWRNRRRISREPLYQASPRLALAAVEYYYRGIWSRLNRLRSGIPPTPEQLFLLTSSLTFCNSSQEPAHFIPHSLISYCALLHKYCNFALLRREPGYLKGQTRLVESQPHKPYISWKQTAIMSASYGEGGAVGGEKINTEIVTLSRYLSEEQTKHKEATGDFTLLCHALQFSFKSIAYYIRRASLINLSGLAGSSNTTGDDQKKLDVIGNDVFIAAMRSSGRVRVLVSEEEEEAIIFENSPNARYAIACDPIDGSSNLDAGVSVGTIFGIYRLEEGAKGTKEDMLRPGTELVAAGFTMYGASAQLVLTMQGGPVNGFTMDNALGEFILTHPNMSMPKRRAIYSCNEGNSKYWGEPVKEWVESLKNADKPYSARYIGSMVADAYRTLLYGGIFAYPADKKSPKGKLRILYECGPMAMVFEQAGGQAIDSNMKRMLTVVPEHIHDRSGIFMGSYDEVQKVIDIHKKHGISG